jgi:hypothetical protein
MTLTHNNIQYTVYWKHYNNVALRDKKGRKVSSSSHCTIVVKDLADPDPNAVAIIGGTAITHPNDQYNRKLGKKVSFKKAVEQINNKEVRTLLWREFHSKSVAVLKLYEDNYPSVADFLKAVANTITGENGVTVYTVNGISFILCEGKTPEEEIKAETEKEVVNDNS